MQVVYVDGEQPAIISHPSIFLAGPTPRSSKDRSWRPEALDLINARGFDGHVFVPERSDWQSNFAYDDQVEWEWRNLHAVTVVMFWVPRVLPAFPAFTTNVEFGLYLARRPTSVIYGRPDMSEKNRYLDWLYKKITTTEPLNDLPRTVATAIERAHELAAAT
jgi:hypothetical protein